jgi:LmbE family N-acetylglucosaminyl deacetylase
MTSLLEQPIALAVSPHLDDIEIACLGTLLRLRQTGWRIAIATLSGTGRPPAGALRWRHLTPHDLATVLEADIYQLEGTDYSVVYSEEVCRCMAALIRATRPALLITHGPYDPRPDCEHASRILRQAALLAPRACYQTHTIAGGSAEPTARVPHLYYCDPLELVDTFGQPVQPSLIVDIGPVLQTKRELVERLLAGMDNSAWSRLTHWQTWARKRGAQVGFAFGEGFWQHVAAPFPSDDLLGEVLGAAANPRPPQALGNGP